jgi:hypothetical protein
MPVRRWWKEGDVMQQATDFLAVSVLAAVSVAVGLTSASYADELGSFQSDRSGDLISTITGILGLDQAEVGDYLQGHPGEIGYGSATLHLE